MPTFSNRKKFINNNLLYKQKMTNKGLKSFIQYETKNLIYPTVEEIMNFDRILHIWKQGDSLEKLATRYYQNSSYWWIIAQFNQKPTEQHYQTGDSVIIPTPLSSVLSAMGN